MVSFIFSASLDFPLGEGQESKKVQCCTVAQQCTTVYIRMMCYIAIQLDRLMVELADWVTCMQLHYHCLVCGNCMIVLKQGLVARLREFKLRVAVPPRIHWGVTRLCNNKISLASKNLSVVHQYALRIPPWHICPARLMYVCNLTACVYCTSIPPIEM